MSLRVFVAGASGVLGRRVVPALVAAGHTVTANVRDPEAAARATASGATTRTIDLFDPAATARIGDDHDAIVNVATSIPTGASAALRRGWAMNDRLRRDASANLSAAMTRKGGHYVGESITFPYVDRGDEWINEEAACTYFWGNETCADAEAAGQAVADAGGTGVVLRFAMFFADDSAHGDAIRATTRRGLFPLPGDVDAFTSFIHIDDAAAAVRAALTAPSGIYNVAEPDPVRRADHASALATAVGRSKLRPLPRPIVRLAGAGVVSLSRSQRISSRKLTNATGWRPAHAIVDAWRADSSV
jgi:nucleoside-diphosphate-sugar epimerase